jgi:hypothetical protein
MHLQNGRRLHRGRQALPLLAGARSGPQPTSWKRPWTENYRRATASFLASWSALCPGNNESAGKRKSGKTRHQSDRSLSSVRGRQRRKANQDRLPRQVQPPGHSPRPQEDKHRPRPQTGADLFCVLVRRKPYRDSTVDYEAASVAKNGPALAPSPPTSAPIGATAS